MSGIPAVHWFVWAKKKEEGTSSVSGSIWTHINVREVSIGWFMRTVSPSFGQRIPVVEASPATAHGPLLLITQRETVVVDEE